MPAVIDTAVTGRELARLLGVTPRTVTDLANRGIVVREGTNRYALAASVLRYCAHLRDLATGRGGEAAVASATAQRARLAKAQADLAETKNAALRRELVPASGVEAEWSGILRTVRAGLLAVPSRCAARLGHLTSHDVAEIDAEVRAVLTQIGEV
jgi:terminase small subunit / prophage DNA-packing protein